MVRAQQARRALAYLMGLHLSALLWRKVRASPPGAGWRTGASTARLLPTWAGCASTARC